MLPRRLPGVEVTGVPYTSGCQGKSPRIARRCTPAYPSPTEIIIPVGGEVRSGSDTDLSATDAREEAEQAEADGLLRQIR
jgi:hypothetical protein